MQLFDRGRVRVPQFLTSARVKEARRRYLDFYEMPTERRAQQRPPDPTPLGDATVLEQLHKLFHGKCAFCEQRLTTVVHRFRPPFDAAPQRSRRDGHLYYSWLSDAWDNYYPICSGCVPKDPSVFPVRGPRAKLPSVGDVRGYVESGRASWSTEFNETALLLDPCRRRSLARDLHFDFNGVVIGTSESGRQTIGHFHLDRSDLVDRRAATFRTYFNDLLIAVEDADRPLPMLEFEKLEFGGGWWLLVRQMLAPLASKGVQSLAKSTAAQRLVQDLQGKPGATTQIFEVRRQLEGAERHAVPAPRPQRRRGDAELRSVTIRHFKGIEALELSIPEPPSLENLGDDIWRPSTPALLLLGENATGKSSALEAIALALCDGDDVAQLNLKLPELLFDPSQVGEGRGRRAREAQVVLRFDDGSRLAVSIKRTRVSADDHERLPPVFAYGAFRQFGISSAPSDVSNVATLFNTTQLLPNPENWLASLDRDSFTMVARELRWILSIDADYDVIAQRGGGCVVVTRTAGQIGTSVSRSTPFGAVSSGFRSVLGMACNIMRGLMADEDFKSFSAARGVVLIDEIEAHLHPRWKLQVMRGLRRVFPLMTFIGTSHDPLCLRGMERGEVVVLNRVVADGTDPSSTKIRAVTELPDIGQLTIDQLLTSDLFSLFSSDAPQMERIFARVADLLVRRREDQPLTAEEAAVLDTFEREIAAVLPVGASEVQRIVQEAVATYLQRRESIVGEQLRGLREVTRNWIVDALDGAFE